jgi:EAL domain-containing protein (putative c-di-GMP-specific phosphodiesterase class I)
VLRETCSQGRQWLDAGLPPVTLAVNVSPHQFRRGDINTLVTTVLNETGFPPKQLELEITESGLMENQDKATGILTNLRNQGIRLAIDDFGTGYSSLAYLKRFPLDVLKIDKSFIDDIPHSKDDMEIAATIIAMARAGLQGLGRRRGNASSWRSCGKMAAIPIRALSKAAPYREEFAGLLRNQQKGE